MHHMVLIALLCCLLLIALFAASEAVLAATNRVRLRQLLRVQSSEENSGASAEELSADAQNFIATVTIAANVPLVAASYLALWLGWDRFGERAALWISLAIALATVSLLQVVPRLLISSAGGTGRRWWAGPARLIVALLRPPVGVMLWLGRVLLGPTGLLDEAPARENGNGGNEEIRDLVETANAGGALEESKELIESIFTFGDTRVHEVMIPRPDIVALPIHCKADEAISTFEESGLSRLPLYEGSIDRVAGILHVKDVLARIAEGNLDFEPRALLRQPLFVPESQKIDEALAAMRGQRTHLAIVMDEYGGTAGLLTVEDVLEELVGEIADEHDRRDDSLVILDERTALADARLHTDDLAGQWGLILPDGEFDTVGGVMMERLGRALNVGDELRLPEAVLSVQSMRGRRPKKIKIVRRETATPENGAPAP